MRRFVGWAIAAFLLLAGSPVAAQDHHTAVGLYGGGLWTSDWNKSPEHTADGRATNASLGGWLAGLHAERYFAGGRLGARFHGAYTEQPLKEDTGAKAIWDTNVYYTDLGLVARVLDPAHDRIFVPFVSAGLGVVVTNPGGLHDGHGLGRSSAIHPGNVQGRFAGVASAGVDVHPATSSGFRIEVADHIAFKSPLKRPDVAEGVAGERHGPVHHVRLTASLLHTIGDGVLPPPAEAPVVPAPPPPPPPPPPSEPEPVWVPVTVCVLDLSAPGALVSQDAVYRPETGDTLAVVDGQRVPLSSVVELVPVVGDASWYVQGAPLQITIAADTTEFQPFGSARHVDAGGLVYVGTAEGLAAFAPIGEAAPALEASPGEELARRLEDEGAADAFTGVQTLYLPSTLTGCEFVPFDRVQQVGKES